MEESKSKTIDVYIECDGTACLVKPGTIDVKDQNNVKFHNKTKGTISLMFSEDYLFPVENGKLKIEAEKEDSVIVRKVQRGFYPFAVYCDIISDFATASSMPIIIIKD